VAVEPTRPRLTVAALLIAIVAGACRPNRDPAVETVRALARAAHDRDAGAITTMLAPDFQGSGGMTRADVEDELRRFFAAYASIEVSISDLTTERYAEFTLAKFQVTFHGTARRIGALGALLPPESRYRFELRLVPGGRSLRVGHAFWEEIPG
jgi:hypothetical protein